MARPWRPERERKPKPTFHKKDKPPKQVPARVAAALAAKQSAANPYKDGKLRIFLDDERACPPGWSLVKNVAEFTETLAAADISTIAGISLDWYLGVGVVDGHGAAQHLADLLRDRRAEFTSLELVCCHSSDIEHAAKMARLIAGVLRDDHEDDDSDLPWVSVHVGHPRETR